MKVSLNLAQRFSNVDLKSIDRSVMLQKIGAQLGAVEEVVDWAPRYDGIVVVRVVSCEGHPNADKLHVCRVDDGGVVKDVERGEDGLVQVVCGAPNVQADMFVAWIPPKATVPSTFEDAEPFVLGSRELRGVVSNGMLASAKELGVSDDHDGILEIATDNTEVPKPGEPITNYFGLDDLIIDCENKMFTHRPDCFGNIGVARELAGINGLAFKSPDWYVEALEVHSSSSLPFTSKNDFPDLVPRFMAQVVEGVTIGKSSTALQAGLTRIGIRPINNIVDKSNFYMHLTAQPTHAFDYDKIKALCDGEVTVFPRMAFDGEELMLLSGKTITLTKDDIVIATDQKAVALAGIMGGAETEVDENTKNIIIEAATFDMYTIRRSSMRHGLFTDAVTRFNKGQSYLQNDRVLAKIVHDICEQTNAVAGCMVDLHAADNDMTKSRVTLHPPVEMSAEFINVRLGSQLSANEIKDILELVEFRVEVASNILTVTAPFWRVDVELPEDVVEEVGRLYGYDKLPVVLPKRLSKPAQTNEILDYKQFVRTSLSRAGANEVLTYSFVHGDLIRNTGTNPENWALHIRNAISPELQYYRTSLLPSLLAKVHSNLRSDMVRSDNNEFAIFEIGKAHVKNHVDDDALPIEFERLAFVFAADAKTANRKYSGASFYQAKQYLLPILPKNAHYTFTPLEGDVTQYPITAPYQVGRGAVISINDEIFGVIGEFRDSVKKSLKLPDFCAGFELDLGIVMKHREARQYETLPNFPKTQQDITFEVDSSVSFADLIGIVGRELEAAKSEHGYISHVMPRSIFRGDDVSKKRITFRIWLSHHEKTLITEEVNKLLESIASVAHEKLSASRI